MLKERKKQMAEIYISVDVEASGPVPATYSLLAIGACVVGRIDENFYTELMPISKNFVPAAMEVAGKTLNDYKRDGQPPAQAMRTFKDWLERAAGKRKLVFVGFNAAFDWSFVNYYFHFYTKNNPFGIGGVDIKSYYMGISGCTWAATRSSRIPKSLKGKSPHTHNALDDAVEQAEMFDLMLKKAHQARSGAK